MSIPSGYRQTQIPRMSPEQLSLFQRLMSQMGGMGPEGVDLLGKLALGDSGAYEAMEKPALNTFNQQTIPGLAARFGSQGTLNSSAFQNAAAGAAGNLSADLGAQRSQLQMQALMRLLGLQNDLLGQQPYEYGLQKKKSLWDYLMEGAGAAANVAGSIYGIPMGGGMSSGGAL